ncbi:MAG: DEAD/DEAH box helicase [Candidatus Aenigmatarchaeota archaeon]
MRSQDDIVAELSRISGFEKLNPVQESALGAGALENNLVIAAPTASGKTFVAEIAAVNCVLNKKKKVVYIVPLKALASEKYAEFKEKYEPLGVKTAISVGDMDSADAWLERYDVIICTSEKMDSLLRHGAPWIENVGLIIADEIHAIGEFNRGPTLEILLTKLRKISRAQIMALSATIRNCRDIADWLDAKLVKSSYRPVKLFEGVYAEKKVKFVGKEGFEVGDDAPETSIAKDTVSRKKQALVFVSTRRSAEAAAEKIGDEIKTSLSADEKQKLSDASNQILGALDNPTKQCARLAACVRNGSAFHHAGLVAKQRQLVEKNFKSGLIKIISATPTLAQGVNLPAFRAIIRDVKRYNPVIGYEYIPVLDYQQMVGRCGRPQFDDYGESILVAKSLDEAEELFERYVMGEPEEISSKLASEPILRMHILSLVASGTCSSIDSLSEFFAQTFYGFQYGSSTDLAEKIEKIIELLKDFGFILSGAGRLKATLIGKRVSELYIDPQTAYNFTVGLKIFHENVVDEEFARNADFILLELLSNALELRPLLSVKSTDLKVIAQAMAGIEKQILHAIPDEFDYEYDEFLRSFKTAMMFRDWANEATEEQMLERYRLMPGELYSKLNIVDWLLYSAQELALLLGANEIIKHVRKTRVRMAYGISEELLALVKLRDIGRVRARHLFNAGFKTLEDLRGAPEQTLAFLVGAGVAKSVKEQLSGKVEEKQFKQKSLLAETD